jgi:hypothetical protein
MPATSAPKQTRAPNKFKVDASLYRLTDAELGLTSALQDWRQTQMGYMGMEGNYMYGSQLIMTDDTLERIVELAHFHQLVDLASIRAQVNWRHSDLWGVQILGLVRKHFPETDSVDPFASVPHRHTLQPTDTDNLPGPSTLPGTSNLQTMAGPLAPNASTMKPRKRNRKCSACGSPTHIGMLHDSLLGSVTDISFSVQPKLSISQVPYRRQQARPQRECFSGQCASRSAASISCSSSSDCTVFFACTICSPLIILSMTSLSTTLPFWNSQQPVFCKCMRSLSIVVVMSGGACLRVRCES